MPTDVKIEFINMLSRAGHKAVEVTRYSIHMTIYLVQLSVCVCVRVCVVV